MRNRLHQAREDALIRSQGTFLTLKVKARLQRVGREMRMLVKNADDQS
jgi:hypothetical protein